MLLEFLTKVRFFKLIICIVFVFKLDLVLSTKKYSYSNNKYVLIAHKKLTSNQLKFSVFKHD